MNFISSDKAQELPTQDTTVSFKKAGSVQWYYVPQDAEINIDAPYDKVRVLTLGPELQPFYDNIVDSGKFIAQAGSFIGLTSAEPTEIEMGVSLLKPKTTGGSK
jgi:hypothetical protein